MCPWSVLDDDLVQFYKFMFMAEWIKNNNFKDPSGMNLFGGSLMNLWFPRTENLEILGCVASTQQMPRGNMTCRCRGGLGMRMLSRLLTHTQVLDLPKIWWIADQVETKFPLRMSTMADGYRSSQSCSSFNVSWLCRFFHEGTLHWLRWKKKCNFHMAILRRCLLLSR